MQHQIKIQNFFLKYFSTQIDIKYSDTLNLYKSALLYLKRSKLLILFIFAFPFLISFLGWITNFTYFFWSTTILISCYCFPIFLTSIVTSHLNNSSFYKKIIIHTGIKKSKNLIIWALILAISLANIWLQISYQNLFNWIRTGSKLNIDYLGMIYANFWGLNISIAFGLIFANILKKQTTINLVAIFFLFLILVFNNMILYTLSSNYAQISYINPFKYILYLTMESWTARSLGHSFNLGQSKVFEINRPWITIFMDPSDIVNFKLNGNPNQSFLGLNFRTILRSLTEETKLDLFTIIGKEVQDDLGLLKGLPVVALATYQDKILDLIMPIIFSFGLFAIVLNLDPLKRSRYG
ncbi:hypothetical protein J2Z62_000693 [Mycoplasmoides fastidiosum]|uniref:ABC transporter permease n=1 Tax=Mycoplasmoides fastidiosum TaxID=92758 RepID=A0ABU0LZX8_9BACT|nr:hypothetical protein [Mycoplasmoides fastidiosum]MDQ0514255.1 hypothetical protein [Mycoplasmoides fastidiosum]UUD37337.1 hypothetical protein NPA10_02010 [Mycoplasmoides fastidiosum]